MPHSALDPGWHQDKCHPVCQMPTEWNHSPQTSSVPVACLKPSEAWRGSASLCPLQNQSARYPLSIWNRPLIGRLFVIFQNKQSNGCAHFNRAHTWLTRCQRVREWTCSSLRLSQRSADTTATTTMRRVWGETDHTFPLCDGAARNTLVFADFVHKTEINQCKRCVQVQLWFIRVCFWSAAVWMNLI